LETFPTIIYPPLRLLDIPLCEMAETALEFQILLDGNDPRFFLKGIGPSTLDFVKGENS
jgi:hypothetical protein